MIKKLVTESIILNGKNLANYEPLNLTVILNCLLKLFESDQEAR